MAAEHTPYLAHLRKQDFDQVVSDRDAIMAMVDSPGWERLNELLDRVYEEAETRLLYGHSGANGRVLEQAEYARLLGFLAGLRQSRWAAEAFLVHAERVRTKEEHE